MKIACPDIDITLLDSLNKRITFLNELTKALELEKTDCVHMRAEDGGISEIKKVSIPETDINHSLIIIKKIRSTPSKYPRKAGKVKKEPIM